MFALNSTSITATEAAAEIVILEKAWDRNQKDMEIALKVGNEFLEKQCISYRNELRTKYEILDKIVNPAYRHEDYNCA